MLELGVVAIKVNKFVLNLSEGNFCGKFKLIDRLAESGSLTRSLPISNP